MRILAAFLVFLFLVSPAFPQQDPQFSQNMFNKIMVNPGSAGSNEMICVTAVNRQQWVGFDGAPVTSAFSISSPFKLFGKNHGIGLFVLNDQVGFETNLGINLAYAYRTYLGSGTLGIGIYGGLINSSLKATWNIPATDFHTPPGSDPSIPAGDESALSFDLGFGVYYSTENLYVGVSSTHINEPQIDYTATANPFFSRYYYAMAGYSLEMKNPAFEFQPVVFIQTDGVLTQMDLSGIMMYNKKYWAGLSYRMGSAFVGLVGFEIFSGIKVGYSYDFATTAIQKYSKGSHEFVVNYCFSLSVDRSPKKYRSIRIL
jgi:type IX secretion system PorP/SprF family membrane protein